MKVLKRDGRLVDFDRSRITSAIEKAMVVSSGGVDTKLSNEISQIIAVELKANYTVVYVEHIQDLVESSLAKNGRFDVAREYVLYREDRSKKRVNKIVKNDQLLTDEFISKYKHLPNPMNQLGSFVYNRTYSRFLPEEGRREYWHETVRRAVEYNCSLVPSTTREEAEKLFDNIYHMKQFLSGRTFWVGGTDVAKHYPIGNYNCAFTILDNFDSFKDLFYLLMVGSGVGVRVLKEDVVKLPSVRTNVELFHEFYTPRPKEFRLDSTELRFVDNEEVIIMVGDSKEGWTQALDFYLKILYSNEYRKVKSIIIDYNNVRPKGEKLKTFGGTASGFESLKNMFMKIDKILKSKTESRIKLEPIDCLDIANIIGENVVVGGVRRTAEIGLGGADDEQFIQAKSDLYKQVNGEWVVDQDIIHRQMSNNSIYYTEKPTREMLKWQIQQMRYSGEPAWVNAEAGAKRRPNMNGVNPCGEILLDANGLCNLTTLNVMAFVDENGMLDILELLNAQKLSVRAGYRMTTVELELPKWDAVQQRDKLLGCSLTGWQDMVNATNISREEEIELLKQLRFIAKDEAEKYANEIGQNVPLLVTTVKPEGTLSQLPTVSSGIHYSHSPYYIRRIRINANDPLVKVCEELGYPVHPEVGQDAKNCSTKVVEFPVKAPEGRTKYDVSAIEQLENYKMFMKHYVDHNCSITVHVRNHEWEEVEEWIWNNWDDVVAVSFLSLDDSFYQLMPYEAIDENEYNKRVSEMKPFIPELMSKYEKEEVELDVGESDCIGNICPIR